METPGAGGKNGVPVFDGDSVLVGGGENALETSSDDGHTTTITSDHQEGCLR